MEDEKKVNKILADLNKGLAKPVWIPSVGFHTFTVVDLANNDATRVIFKSSEGVPVKTFINTETGELRTYWAKYVVKG